jgi:hypothetical protein
MGFGLREYLRFRALAVGSRGKSSGCRVLELGLGFRVKGFKGFRSKILGFMLWILGFGFGLRI